MDVTTEHRGRHSTRAALVRSSAGPVRPGGPAPAAIPASARERWLGWWTAQSDACACAGPVEQLAARQGFVLTRAQARACGMNEAGIRRRVRRGTWWTPRRGVLAVVRVPAPEPGDEVARRLARRRRIALAGAAAALARPGQVVSGDCAAVLYGLPLFVDPDRPQLTAGPVSTPGTRAALLVRPATLTTDEVARWFGVAVTTPERTVVDLARHGRRSGLIAADAALHERAVTRAAIDAALARAGGWPGIRRARHVLGLASPLAESPLESLTRLALCDWRVPAPQLQALIYDPLLGCTYRVDMLWPRQRLILEVDGRVKYTADELWREKRRQERLERLGYRVLRVMWSDIAQDWPETARRILDALGRPAPPSPLV